MDYRRFALGGLFGLLLLGAEGARAQSSFGVTVNLNSGITLQQVYFAYDTDFSNNGPITVVSEGTVSNGETLTGSASNPFTAADSYTMIGDYVDDGGTEHLVVDFNGAGAAITNGHSFDSTIGALTGVTEADVLLYLSEGDSVMTDYITDGWTNAHPYMPTIGTAGTLMGFSNGAPIGSTNPTPAPEPATFVALGGGVLVWMIRRRS